MGADGHIYTIRVLDREWYEKSGEDELHKFIENYYKKNVRIKREQIEPTILTYFYKDFLGVEGQDVIIIYWDTRDFNWFEVGLPAIESEEFDKRFKGKLQRIRDYEVWT